MTWKEGLWTQTQTAQGSDGVGAGVGWIWCGGGCIAYQVFRPNTSPIDWGEVRLRYSHAKLAIQNNESYIYIYIYTYIPFKIQVYCAFLEPTCATGRVLRCYMR